MSLSLRRRRPTRALPQALAVLAAGRAGLGVALVLRPGLLPAGLGASRPGADWAVQMLGAREIGLGLGALVAGRRGDRRAGRLWLAAGLLSDATDAVVLSRAAGAGAVSRGPGLAVVGLAAAATATQAAGLAGRR